MSLYYNFEYTEHNTYMNGYYMINIHTLRKTKQRIAQIQLGLVQIML